MGAARMSLASCPKCWDDLCKCGYQYAKWPKDARIKQAAAVLGMDVTVLENFIYGVVPDNHSQKDAREEDERAIKERQAKLLKDLGL